MTNSVRRMLFALMLALVAMTGALRADFCWDCQVAAEWVCNGAICEYSCLDESHIGVFTCCN